MTSETQLGPVAVLGLGTMGLAMARTLNRQGFQVRAYNRTPGRAAEVTMLGARAFSSPREAATGCRWVVCVVHDEAAVEAVLTGPGGALTGLQPGSVAINMATVSPASERRMAAAAAARGVAYLDAPVTGGEAGARAGTLTTMVGGEPKALASAAPVLRALSALIVHCGPHGAGQASKLCNQIMVATNLAGVAEAMGLATSLGLDRAQVLKAARGGAGASWQLAELGPRILVQDWQPGFRIRALVKDLQLVLEAGAGLDMRTTRAAHALACAAAAAGDAEAGSQAVARQCQKISPPGLPGPVDDPSCR